MTGRHERRSNYTQFISSISLNSLLHFLHPLVFTLPFIFLPFVFFSFVFILPFVFFLVFFLPLDRFRKSRRPARARISPDALLLGNRTLVTTSPTIRTAATAEAASTSATTESLQQRGLQLGRRRCGLRPILRGRRKTTPNLGHNKQPRFNASWTPSRRRRRCHSSNNNNNSSSHSKFSHSKCSSGRRRHAARRRRRRRCRRLGKRK